jgi:hypothetical protein
VQPHPAFKLPLPDFIALGRPGVTRLYKHHYPAADDGSHSTFFSSSTRLVVELVFQLLGLFTYSSYDSKAVPHLTTPWQTGLISPRH